MDRIIDNGFVKYFVDPYGDCEDLQKFHEEYGQGLKEAVILKEARTRRELEKYDHTYMYHLDITSVKDAIDNFFELKHRSCKHPKRSKWTLARLQFVRLFSRGPDTPPMVDTRTTSQ